MTAVNRTSIESRTTHPYNLQANYENPWEVGMSITVVGLGAGNPLHLTEEAREALVAAGEVYLRTEQHPASAAVPAGVVRHSFDPYYEAPPSREPYEAPPSREHYEAPPSREPYEAPPSREHYEATPSREPEADEDFASIYAAIADRVIALGSRPEGVTYAVPGHPLVGETSVQMILSRAQQQGIEVRLVPGISFLDASLVAVRKDALDGLQIVDAQTLAERHFPGLDPETPALVGQLHDRQLASDAKLTLLEQYPDKHTVVLLRALGTPDSEFRELALHELDHQRDLDDMTSLFIPPLPPPASVASLQDTVARLRSPDGCAWDRAQTPRSLRSHLLEEVHEVLEALDAGDPERLREELGDLLFHVIIQVQMATESGEFRMADVVGGVVEKLVRRHPHVFGGERIEDPREVVAQWERIKAAEREAHIEAEREPTDRLPALVRAQHRGRLSQASEGGLLRSLHRTSDRLFEALMTPDRERLLGQLLLEAATLAEKWGVDAEGALRQALAAGPSEGAPEPEN